MIAALRIYLGVSWADFVAYRIVFFLYALWSIFPPLIYLAVWSTVAGNNGIGGFSRGDFVAYYLTFMIVNHLAASIEIHTVEWEIRQGAISARLLLPVHPALRPLASNMGFKGIGLFVVIPGLLLLAALFHPHFRTTPGLVALCAVSTLAAGILQFMIGFSIALLAFWITRADAVNQLHSMLLFFLSGELAPLALLPSGLRQAADLLPYRYMASFPVEVLGGRLSSGALAAGCALQLFWLAAAWLLFQFTWSRGVRRYAAVGG